MVHSSFKLSLHWSFQLYWCLCRWKRKVNWKRLTKCCKWSRWNGRKTQRIKMRTIWHGLHAHEYCCYSRRSCTKDSFQPFRMGWHYERKHETIQGIMDFWKWKTMEIPRQWAWTRILGLCKRKRTKRSRLERRRNHLHRKKERMGLRRIRKESLRKRWRGRNDGN